MVAILHRPDSKKIENNRMVLSWFVDDPWYHQQLPVVTTRGRNDFMVSNIWKIWIILLKFKWLWPNTECSMLGRFGEKINEEKLLMIPYRR